MHTSMESQPTTTGVGWRRVRFTLAASVVLGALLSLPMETATYIVVIRGIVVGMSAMLAFSLFEKWPRAEPRRIPRWVLQLLGIVVIVPVAAWFAYWLTTGGHPRFDQEEKRVVGYMMLTFTGAFFGPWIALGAMLRQRDAFEIARVFVRAGEGFDERGVARPELRVVPGRKVARKCGAPRAGAENGYFHARLRFGRVKVNASRRWPRLPARSRAGRCVARTAPGS